ncbi:fasciclin domain-containing protein [Pontiellaceae bacterium B12227]|nr:fasciclin domain-containing protein [Pontiellaceae bacterium B12227]
MKLRNTILIAILTLTALTLTATATPAYYTIFHAMDQATMEYFRDGGNGSISISKDGGATYRSLTEFRFDQLGRGVARVYELNRVSPDTIVKFEASFNESKNGQPTDISTEVTAQEFLDSLIPYKRWRWLTYSPVYVTYDTRLSIVEIAVSDGRFTNLVSAVVQEDLAETLGGDGSYTVFAPTDDAFAALGLTGNDLLEIDNLIEILLYHVLPVALNGNEVAVAMHLETLLGKDVDIRSEGDELFINDSRIILENIHASNGIIHVIDAVLLPPALPSIVDIAVSDGRFTNLVAAVVQENLAGTLDTAGPFTVFAPTDNAFAALGATGKSLLDIEKLGEILLYHVVEGRLTTKDIIANERLTTLLGEHLQVNVTDEGVFINDSKVIVEDIKAENGIIHVIDMVLIPEEMPDVVDVAEAAGQFKTLLAVLQQTGLDEVLRTDGPFTVLAPTDDAFEKLPGWLLNYLTNNPEYLKQVLLYHVVPGDLTAGEVLENRTLKTVTGRNVHPRYRQGDVYINNAKVIAADIEAKNGTIHVINKVLIPWYRY